MFLISYNPVLKLQKEKASFDLCISQMEKIDFPHQHDDLDSSYLELYDFVSSLNQ